MFRRILKEQRGAFMVFFAILVPLFIGMIGFAVDAGFIYMQKAKMQDIADAAALAGAARLNDGEDKEGHVTSAVRAYAEANGLSGVATAMASLDESSDLPTKYDKLKILQGIQYNVTDKDGKQRDHVKVVIAKRVPTFFINVLFPDQKDGVVVKVAAAAEYVEGEEAPVSYGGAKIYCAHMEPDNIYDNKTIVVDQGEDFSLYLGASNPFANKLPIGTVGTMYNSDWGEKMPEGWQLVRTSRNDSDWNLNDPKEKAEKEALDNERKQYKSLMNQAEHDMNVMRENINDYKNNVKNKRYIGPGSDGKVINTIKDDDKNLAEGIELFMNGTDVFDYGWMNLNNCLTYDDELKGVKKISKLIMNQQGTIDTTGVTYGNIYINGQANIVGNNNIFNGVIYANGYNFLVGGKDNKFSLDTSCILASENTTLKIGKYQPVIWENTSYYDSDKGAQVYVKTCKLGTEKTENNASWHMYWIGGSSSGSGSSGSDDSGDETKAHVRLVE